MIVFIKINSNNTFGTIPDTQLTNVSAPVSNNPMNPDAQGVQKAGFDMTELGLRYMLVGLVMNFFSGWVTDFTTKMVMKQQGIELSNELK